MRSSDSTAPVFGACPPCDMGRVATLASAYKSQRRLGVYGVLRLSLFINGPGAGPERMHVWFF